MSNIYNQVQDLDSELTYVTKRNADLKARVALLENALRQCLREIDKNTCQHEDVCRAGTIWTICSQCGAKWDDGDGGFRPHDTPQWLYDAWDILGD